MPATFQNCSFRQLAQFFSWIAVDGIVRPQNSQYKSSAVLHNAARQGVHIGPVSAAIQLSHAAHVCGNKASSSGEHQRE